MKTPPQTQPDKRTVHSFESQSIGWWKRSGVWIVGVLVIIAVFLANQSCTGGDRKNAAQTEAVSNARQIGLALFEFLKTYGSFPEAGTLGEVRRKTGTGLPLGTNSSNEYFRQLFAAGAVENESIFYAQVKGTHKPDNIFMGTRALEKGECGFTYFTGAFGGCDPNRPIAGTPMIPGTDRFDPKPFEGKAVVLSADNSVMSCVIDKNGHVILDKQNLMDPTHPIWQGKPPQIAWPDL